MQCDDVQGLLEDYEAGELDGEPRRLVKQHLADCAECARLLGLLTAERAFLQENVRRRQPPRALRQALDEALAAWERPVATRRLTPGHLVRVAALVLCVVGIASLVWFSRSPAAPEPQQPVREGQPAREEQPAVASDAELEDLLGEIALLTAEVDALTSRPVLWDDQMGRFPRLTAEINRSQEHLVQQDREAVAALTLAAARLREDAGDQAGSQARRDFVLAYMPDTLVAQSLILTKERSQP